MKILEAVRAKVIAAVPEIVSLRLGCELKTNNKGVKRFYVGTNQEEQNLYFIDQDQVSTEDEQFYTEENEEDIPRERIIGRPITLADVLRAIRKHYIEQEMVIRGEHELLNIWNLALPLDEQDQEVIEFLAKVLGA